MKIEYILCGEVPKHENVSRLGRDPLYRENANRNCQAFKRMLVRLFPVPSAALVMFLLKGTPTDHGTRLDIYLAFDCEDPAATQYAMQVRKGIPVNWDSIAKYEIDWYLQKDKYLEKVALGELDVQSIPENFRDIRPPIIGRACDSDSTSKRPPLQLMLSSASRKWRPSKTANVSMIYSLLRSKLIPARL